LADTSSGLIASNSSQQLTGYAAYGSSIRSAVESLVAGFGLELLDDGTVLRSPSGSAPFLIGDELGNSSDNNPEPRLEREQASVRSVPAALRITYYDPARDYQTGEARAVAGEAPGSEERQDLPAVLSAGDAKSLAEQALARAWTQRDKLTLRLPPSRLDLEPGDQLELSLNPSTWAIQKITIDGFVVLAELSPSAAAAATVAGDGGRIVPNEDVVAGPVTLALLDIPNVASASNIPTVLLAASSETSGWKPQTVAIELGGQRLAVQTARSKSILGSAATALAAADASLIDEQNSFEVQLLDADQWLTSCDDDALAGGTNLAALGSELIQFGSATSLGSGRFELRQLLRGRGGTEWACSGHAAGESFCLLQASALQEIALPGWSLGAEISATTVGGTGASITFGGEALRPPSPVNLTARRSSGGDLVIGWTRRSRQGFAWVDGVDSPLGEGIEQYRVMLTGTAGSIELTTGQPDLTVLSGDLVPLGPGTAIIQVTQIGDFASSRLAQLSISLS
jgi:hypothetical protein